MRSARGPSSSRRHTGIEPRARTSSTSPSVRSLATTLPAAPPVSFGEGSRARSSRCEAADRSNNWVSVNFTGILHSVGDDDCRRHHRSPAMAMKPAGQDPATRPSGLVEPSHTTALLQPKSQSFLDHLIAGFWPTGSSNNPDAAEQSANTAPSRAPGASRLALVLRCSDVMSRKHSRTSIAYRSPKQSDRACDGRGVDAGSGVVEPVEKPDADAKCFGDQIQPACRHA